MRTPKLSIALGSAALVVAAAGAIPALGADHADAPLTKANKASDITDVYVFKGEGDRPVLVMNVNPLTTPADTASLALDPATLYEFKIDTNADAIADIGYKLAVSGTGPMQDLTFYRADGAVAEQNMVGGNVIGTGKASSGGAVTTIALSNGGKLFVGPRDDPFFFDLAGFQAGLKFTGVDTFKGTNVTSIVYEAPRSPADQWGLWATTTKGGTQVDRMGRPAINTVFIPADQKDAFNSNIPSRDASIYTDAVVAALASLGAGPDLASVLLPDILTIDYTKAATYLNGRGLGDDVIDISLQAITGNAAIGDMVDANDRPFANTFPYLAAPNGMAPAAPDTGSGLAVDGSDGNGWALPVSLSAAAVLMAMAAYTARRRTTTES